MSPLRSLYEHPFDKPPEHNLRRLPPDPGGLRRLQSFFFNMIFELFKKNAYIKFLFEMYLEKKGVGEGASCTSISFLLLKSELELSISKQITPILSLYEHPFYKNHIWP